MHQPSYFCPLFAIPISVHLPLNASTILVLHFVWQFQSVSTRPLMPSYFCTFFFTFQSFSTRPLMHQPSYFCTFFSIPKPVSTRPLMHKPSYFCTFFAIPISVHLLLNASTILVLYFVWQFQSVSTRPLMPSYFCTFFFTFQSFSTRPLMHPPKPVSTRPLMHKPSYFCTFFAIPIGVHPPLNALLFLHFFLAIQSFSTRPWDLNLQHNVGTLLFLGR